jgi:mevalonate kinase
VAGLDCGLYARARPLAARVLRLRSTTMDGTVYQEELALEEDALAAAAQRGGFYSYAAGVAYVLTTHHAFSGGLELDNHATTMPLGKGLSSSAAFCVLVARAFNRCHGLGLTARGEMQAAYEGERLTPSQCGRMDQAVAFGRVPVVMDYEGDVLRVRPATLGAALHLVLVDLAAAKDTVAILAALQAAFPHPRTREEAALAELLGPINQRLTAAAVRALAAGDAAALGALMVEAQREFDARAGAVCPAQLGARGSPVLRRLLTHAALQPHIHGGKGVGSQGDGTAQLLCRDAEAQAAVCAIVARDMPGMACTPLTLQPTTGGGGAQAQPAVAAAAPAPAAARVAQLRRALREAEAECARLEGGL